MSGRGVVPSTMPLDRFRMQHLAVPAVVFLISFLAYGSQLVLLPYLEPGDLLVSQRRKFNLMVSCIWISYYRAVRTDPGHVPPHFQLHNEKTSEDGDISVSRPVDMEQSLQRRQRWCRKCDRVKPARAHHCKVCMRCIPKMDHHCPWTANCVSHFTLPHFIRFLFYATTSMVYLQYFFLVRAAVIWENRALPSYLGPSLKMLSLLILFLVVNSLTLFSVGIMCLRSLYDIAINTTTIESWEISRHHQLLRRAKAMGGFLYGPDGQEVRIQHQEFPYDIGIWANLCQAMATRNPIGWFWVFARGRKPVDDEGLVWETNGFETADLGWPPIDPDRIPRTRPWGTAEGSAFTHKDNYGYGELSPQEELQAFKARQQEDLQRLNDRKFTEDEDGVRLRRRKRFHDRFDAQTHALRHDAEDASSGSNGGDESGEEGWRDSDGNRLKDLGVDEDFEFYDEDNVPLAELMHRKREQQKSKI